ncbi:MAG: EamA family transporter [Flavobacteriales bacterium]|nr:EamA family transporter [Flavobacteriales bacterium]
MHNRTLALLALFVVNLIYGVNYVVAKGLMPGVIGPSGFILLRVLGAVMLFWLVRLFNPEPVRKEDALRLLLCAVFGVALNQLMFFHGLMRTSPVHASIIMVATPILVLVISGVLIGERIGWGKLLGVALGAAGALILIFYHSDEDSSASVLGDLFILINACSFGIYLVMVKPLLRRYTAITVMAWSFLIGSLLVLPFGARELWAVHWNVLTNPQIASMAFVVVMVTFVAYLLNTWALRFVNPSVVGTFIYLQPVLATAITLFTSGKNANGLVQWVCAAMIFLGVHLVNRADSQSNELG